MAITTTFFVAANRDYEFFAISYATSVLLSNPDSRIEVCVDGAERFIGQNKTALGILNERYPHLLLIRDADFTRATPNAVRFIETPRILTEYVYLADIDFLIFEHVTPVHIARMQETKLPYSNKLRGADTKKLTGLHFTRTETYYPVRVPNDTNLRCNDEELLYKIVEPQGLPEWPDPWQRPEHGLHLSLNRHPYGSSTEAGWGLHHDHMAASFLALENTDLWRAVAPHFDKRFLIVLLLVKTTIDSLHKHMRERKNARYDYYRFLKSVLGHY